MTVTCEEVQAQAAGLASLPAGDPERQAAEAHARTCTACRAALAEGAAVLALIDRALPLEAPQPEALARTASQILRELAAERPSARRSVAGSVAALGATWAGCWLLVMAPHRGQGAAVLVSAAIALVTALVGAAALTWGGRVLPALPALSLLLSLSTGGSAGLQVAQGIKCAGFELALAAVPLAIAFALVRRGRLAPVGLAAAAATGALIGQAALHVACHASPDPGHALVFHTLPILLALGVGALAGRRRKAVT
jgi:hypothetical protein